MNSALLKGGLIHQQKTIDPGQSAQTSLHNSVCAALDLKTLRCWFDSRAGQPNNY